MKKLLLSIACLYAFSVFAAIEPSELFKSLDADGNGRLSKSEVSAEAKLASDFKKYDLDGDGEISSHEFIAYVKSIQ